MPDASTTTMELADAYGAGAATPDESMVAQDQGAADTPAAPVQEKLGFLLDELDELKVWKRVEKWWTQWDKAMRRWDAEWRVFERWRKGDRLVRLAQADDDLTDWPPEGTLVAGMPVPNKLHRLAKRVVATVFVDVPAADCDPATDSSEDRDSAEFSTRYLAVETGEDGLNVPALLEDAVDKAMHLGSTFLYSCVDPHGGGWVPWEVQAHPLATDANNPLVDPATGQESPDVTVRYLAMDGATLTDDPAKAKRGWLPKIKKEVWTGRHVRFTNLNATHLDTAEGVVLCIPTTLGALKAAFPKTVGTYSKEQLVALAAYRPTHFKRLLPQHLRQAVTTQPEVDEQGVPQDDTLCFPLTCYLNKSFAYPKAAYAVVCGGVPQSQGASGQGYILHREPWSAVMEDGKDEPLDIPLAQVKCLDDTLTDNPYGATLVADMGPADEIRFTLYAGFLHWLERFNYPNMMFPLGSEIRPEDWNARDGRPILYTPNGGTPTQEAVPDMPVTHFNLLEKVDKEQDSDSGLEQTAQGAESPDSQSGVAKQIVVERANIAIGQIYRHARHAYVRDQRITLQLTRARYDTPQRMKYLGDDGSYKERHWTRADLGSTRDVRISRGTFTMLPASAKQSIAVEQFSIAAKAGDPMAYQRFQRAISGNVDPILGLKDDPWLLRVRRQISQWEEGPNEETKAAGQQYQTMLPQMQQNAQMMTMVDAQMAMQAQMPPPPPQPLPPDPMTQAAAACFQPFPNDEDPTVARIRYDELNRAMCGGKYAGQPAPWRAAFDAEYQRMRAAAGIATVAEQQQAAQAQAQQQAQQQQAMMMAKQQEAESGRDAKREQQANAMQHDEKMQAAKQSMSVQQGVGAPPMMPAQLPA